MRFQATVIGLLVLMFGSSAADAATYCVGSMAQLRQAMNDAAVDGEDSTIQVRTGSYTLSSDARYENPGESYIPTGKLTLRGGYNGDCSEYSSAGGASTITSSNGSVLEFVTQTGTVSIGGLGFSGAHLLLSSRVLSFCIDNRPSFNLRRLRVDQAGVVISSQCHDVLVENSLLTNGVAVTGTTSPAGSSLDISMTDYEDDRIGKIELFGNTVVDGRVNLSSCCSYTGRADLYNNIFQRSGTEVFAEDTRIYARHNRFDPISFSGSGALIAGSGENLSVAPDLDANYRANVASPMLDSGTGNVPGGLSPTDQAGGDRNIGTNVDRGARESGFDGSGIFTVVTTESSGVGSLAWAVNNANQAPGVNTIRFDITGPCPRIIPLTNSLPIGGKLLIDGRTQNGSQVNTGEVAWNGVPCVLLRGNGGIGLEATPEIGNDSLTVRGLAFEGFELAISLAYGDAHQILGNQFGGRIGTSGPVLTGNGQAIALLGSRARIGGTAEASRNLISGSSGLGVQIVALLGSGGDQNEIINNLIGVDKNGFSALPNATGVQITGSNNLVRGNRIGGNVEDGVRISGQVATGNRIEENWIGGGFSTLSNAEGNGRMGVMVQGEAYGNTIGPDNLIGRNGDDGIRIFETARGGNRITANQVFRNGALGIDLGDNGVDANGDDPSFCQPPAGCAANRGQNYPVLSRAQRRTTGLIPADRPVQVRGTLRSAIGGPYRIELFGGESCEANDFGEGRRLIGSLTLTIPNEAYCPEGSGLCLACSNSNCTREFSTFVSEIDLEEGDVVTATATDPNGNTSEFSACETVTREIGAVGSDIFADGFED